jgi:glc operon protein GlcG
MTKATRTHAVRGNAVLAALLAGGTGFGLAGAAAAPAPPPPSRPMAYGMPIDLAAARKAAAAAEAEAKKVSYAPDVIVIVDPDGALVYLERMDEAQIGSIAVAIDKARSAALFRRPTKVFADLLAKGNMIPLTLRGAAPIAGGVPLVMDGKIVGAIGASGGTGAQDGRVAAAGAAALK